MKAGRQTTLCDQVAISGIGVHSGLPVTLTLHPADPNSGIIFVRSGMQGRYEREVRADVRAVAAGSVGNGGKIERTNQTALVGNDSEIIAIINCRTGRSKRVRLGRSAVIAEPSGTGGTG